MGQALDVYWAVADTRMLMTLGKDAKARLTALASGKAPPEPNKAVAEAQAAAAGARSVLLHRRRRPCWAWSARSPTNSGW